MTETKTFTKKDILDCNAEFTWFWGADFFVETPFGNFHWKDPDYEGDNSFVLFDGDIMKFCAFMSVEYGRSKGTKLVERYCGENIDVRLNDFSLPLPDDLTEALTKEYGAGTILPLNPEMKAFVKGWRMCVALVQKSGTKVE